MENVLLDKGFNWLFR